MKTNIAPVCLLLLLFLTGCPEPPMVSRTVSLSFPTSAKQNKVSLFVSNIEVQEALKIIDAVLVSKGFVRDQNPDNTNVHGFVASYSKSNDEGLRLMGDLPGIYLKDNLLEVVFSEGRNPSGRLSIPTKETIKSLQKELGVRYGANRVKIQN